MREPLSGGQNARYPIEMPLDEVLVHATLHLIGTAAVTFTYFAALYGFGIHEALPYDLGAAISGGLGTLPKKNNRA